MQTFQSVNPFTEETIAGFNLFENHELNEKINTAAIAAAQWKKSSFENRAALFYKLHAILLREADNLGNMAAMEMGKLASHAKAEVLKSAGLCTYYAKEAEQLLKPENRTIENGLKIRISKEPLGVVLGIFPWNFPFWQILRSALPTMMAGNTVLVKPAPNVPQCSLALQEIMNEAGFGNLYQTLFINEQQIASCIENPRVNAVSLTGSGKAGSAVAALAGKYLKPVVLELGGSDPLIILEDANLNEIIDQVVFARFQNNGQSCVAAKRFLVQKSIYPQFLSLLIEKVSTLVSGNPLDENANLGPLARKDLRDLLANQVKESLAMGATILYQNSKVPERGWFYPPTLLGNVQKGMPAYEQELFGPVVSIFSFGSTQEAIALANDTPYGLGASIYTQNLNLAQEMAASIESGMVYINTLVKSDVRFPFGGIKASGFGRELGKEGLFAFTQVKSTWVK